VSMTINGRAGHPGDVPQHRHRRGPVLCRATTRTLLLSWCFLCSSGCSPVLAIKPWTMRVRLMLAVTSAGWPGSCSGGRCSREESGRSCPPGPTEQARSAPRGSAGRHCRAPRREPEACGALASGMRFSTGAARWAYGHEMITLPEHIGERGSGKPG
jgi:hypothetical protein